MTTAEAIVGVVTLIVMAGLIAGAVVSFHGQRLVIRSCEAMRRGESAKSRELLLRAERLLWPNRIARQAKAELKSFRRCGNGFCGHCGALWDETHEAEGCPVRGATERLLGPRNEG